jgi:hypothetical protein
VDDGESLSKCIVVENKLNKEQRNSRWKAVFKIGGWAADKQLLPVDLPSLMYNKLFCYALPYIFIFILISEICKILIFKYTFFSGIFIVWNLHSVQKNNSQFRTFKLAARHVNIKQSHLSKFFIFRFHVGCPILPYSTSCADKIMSLTKLKIKHLNIKLVTIDEGKKQINFVH